MARSVCRWPQGFDHKVLTTRLFITEAMRRGGFDLRAFDHQAPLSLLLVTMGGKGLTTWDATLRQRDGAAGQGPWGGGSYLLSRTPSGTERWWAGGGGY